MRRAGWLIAIALGGLTVATLATAGPPEGPAPAPVKTPMITINAEDFFGQSGSMGGPAIVPAAHPVLVTSLDGTERWKGETDVAGIARVNINSKDFILTILCPDGQHQMYQAKHVRPGGDLDPMTMTVRLKPTGPRWLGRTLPVGDSFEPGDNTSAGAVLINPGNVQAHNFGPAARDRDWVKFYAKFDKVYELVTSNLQRRADTVVTLYHKTESGLVPVLTADDDWRGFGSTIVFRAPASGYFFAEIRPFSDDTVPPETAYGLSLVERGGDASDVPGDIAGAATLAMDSELVDQLLDETGDRDMFAVELEGLVDYTFETFDLSGPTDTVIRLLRADGTEVTSNDDDVRVLSSGLVYMPAADGAGTYYVEVSNYEDHGGSSFRYGVRAKSHGGLPHADAGPDQRFCDPATRTITLDGSRSGNAQGPYTFTTDTTGARPFIDGSLYPGAMIVAEGDDVATLVPLPFTFNFYGGAKTNVYVGSNGFLTFNAAGAGSFINGAIPDTAAPNDALYGMWSDLNSASGGDVWVANGVIDGQNAFIATWRNVAFFGDASQNVNFNIILFEDDCIEYRYGTGVGAWSTGALATIGAENAPGTLGPQIALFNASAATPGTSYRLCQGGFIARDCMAGATVTTTSCAFDSTGTNLPITCDDCGISRAIGFTFPFFGAGRTSVNVCSNGYLTFGTTTGSFTNGAIPSAATPNDAIYPFWDDLYLPGGGNLRERTAGVAPNRSITWAWVNVPHFASTSPGSFSNFSVTLHESGRIDYCYGTHNTTNPFNGTIGIENQTGTSGTMLGFATSGDNFPANTVSYNFIPAGAAPALTYDWDIDGDMDFADGVTGRNPTITVNAGTTGNCAADRRQITIGLRVTDCATGLTDTDTMVIDNGDFTPPLVTPSYLGPALMYIKNNNHECTLWNASDLGSATDNCGVSNFGIGGTGCDGVWSTQGIEETGTGDGNFTPDGCVNDGPCGDDPTRATFKIREERNGNQDPAGADRAYFVDATAMDLCGNSGTMMLGVCITHSESAASTAACDIGTGLVPACPGTDNHGNKPCATP